MIDYKEIEEKIKSMSAHDIIMSMVEGLRNPKARVDMGTYGAMRKGVCYVHAATNAILHIVDANEEEVEAYVKYRSTCVDYPLWGLKGAIGRLSLGWMDSYNEYAKALGFAQIVPIPGQKLPKLRNDYTEDELQEYEKLAKYQLTTKNQKQ